MYAIVKDRGKQYKVRVGERCLIDLKADAQTGQILATASTALVV